MGAISAWPSHSCTSLSENPILMSNEAEECPQIAKADFWQLLLRRRKEYCIYSDERQRRKAQNSPKYGRSALCQHALNKCRQLCLFQDFCFYTYGVPKKPEVFHFAAMPGCADYLILVFFVVVLGCGVVYIAFTHMGAADYWKILMRRPLSPMGQSRDITSHTIMCRVSSAKRSTAVMSWPVMGLQWLGW